MVRKSEGWLDRPLHDQVVTRLGADVYPEIGLRPIAEVEPPELLAVLRKVEKRGALEIAKRLRQTVGQVFRYGIVTGRAKRDPSIDLKGALKASGRRAHHNALTQNRQQFGRLDIRDGPRADLRKHVSLK